MHVCKRGQISEVGAKFPRKYGPRGGQIFGGGAKFPVTPALGQTNSQMSFKLPLLKSRRNAKIAVHAVPNLDSFKWEEKLMRNVCLEKEASDMC